MVKYLQVQAEPDLPPFFSAIAPCLRSGKAIFLCNLICNNLVFNSRFSRLPSWQLLALLVYSGLLLQFQSFYDCISSFNPQQQQFFFCRCFFHRWFSRLEHWFEPLLLYFLLVQCFYQQQYRSSPLSAGVIFPLLLLRCYLAYLLTRTISLSRSRFLNYNLLYINPWTTPDSRPSTLVLHGPRQSKQWLPSF